MKKLFYFFAFLSLLFIYSCSKDDSITDPGTQETPKYTLIDSIPHAFFWEISMGDENSVYLVGAASLQKGFKIINGIRSQIDFQDVNFRPFGVDAYSSSYYAFSGYSTNVTALKIFSNGVLSTVLLNTYRAYSSPRLKIIQPGRIAVFSDSSVYLYDNGVVSEYPKSPEEYFDAIAGSGNRIDFSSYSNEPSKQQVYRLENNTFTQLENVQVTVGYHPSKFSIAGALVKFTAGSSSTIIHT